MTPLNKNETILRLPEVRKITGLSTSSIYVRISAEEFPESISLGGRSVGWLHSEIMEWINERIENSRKHEPS